VVITNIESGSLAEQGALRPGDVIVAIGTTSIKDVSEYRDAIKDFNADKGIRLQVVRQGIRRFVFLRSAE
jgi:S1-C subfamily serine protease